MQKSKIVLGMKVVPTQKSIWGELEHSIAWKMAKQKGIPYLYVTGVESIRHRTAYRLWIAIENNGDFFLAEDFEPYQGEL